MYMYMFMYMCTCIERDIHICIYIYIQINIIIANPMVTLTKLDLFWRHSNCSKAIKVPTADAVLRSKLLYGIESTQLIPSMLKRFETFQFKVLRQI